MTNSRLVVLFAASSLALASFASADPEKWLLPVCVSLTGQGDSHYGCDLTFANGGSAIVNLEGISPECPLPVCPQPSEGFALPPGQMATGFEPNGGPGRFVTVDNASSLAATLRLYVTRSGSAPQTIALPVVSLEEFTTLPVHLVKVMPTDSRRGHLRVYAERPVRVMVRLLDWYGGVIEETALELSTPADVHDPAYGEIAPLPRATHPYRVEVETTDDNVPIWAFVSQADNEDLRFTVITP